MLFIVRIIFLPACGTATGWLAMVAVVTFLTGPI